MNETSKLRIINARPTKEFFISMLVKDVDLARSIIDLVDNSVDGAHRIRPDRDFTGLKVDIRITPKQFEISDNCGGISVEIATDYAFRFGRPSEATEVVQSRIGLFGVGMKRTIFKLGREFRVESITDTSRFVIKENIEEWMHRPAWEFAFDKLVEGEAFSPNDQGTKITVTSLLPSVASDFQSDFFLRRLKDEMTAAQLEPLEYGLTITLNEQRLKPEPLALLHSEDIKPAYREMVLNGLGDNEVRVRIYTGVYRTEEPRQDPRKAGWYIVCNGRLVLRADRTSLTGWGTTGGNSVPNFSNDFAMFRGYAFFDSDTPELLPWNTTKTGVDSDSPIFRTVRNEMVTLMRPVITFLRSYFKESRREDIDDKILVTALETASAAKLSEVETAGTFTYPTPLSTRRKRPDVHTIQYRKPVELVKRVQEVLGVTTLREVGEETFDYFYKRECDN